MKFHAKSHKLQTQLIKDVAKILVRDPDTTFYSESLARNYIRSYLRRPRYIGGFDFEIPYWHQDHLPCDEVGVGEYSFIRATIDPFDILANDLYYDDERWDPYGDDNSRNWRSWSVVFGV